MRVQISGTRNGDPWPTPPAEIDVPAEEAQSLIAAGLAEPSKGKAPA